MLNRGTWFCHHFAAMHGKVTVPQDMFLLRAAALWMVHFLCKIKSGSHCCFRTVKYTAFLKFRLKAQNVQDILYTKQFLISKGSATSPHSYIQGGSLSHCDALWLSRFISLTSWSTWQVGYLADFKFCAYAMLILSLYL